MAVLVWRALCILPLLFVTGSSNFFFYPFHHNPYHNPLSEPSPSSIAEDRPELVKAFPDDASFKSNPAEDATFAIQSNYPGNWELFIQNSGVSAMHAILLPNIDKVLMYDATIWRISQIKLPPEVPCHVMNQATGEKDCWAHSVLLDVDTGRLRPLKLDTDTWCSSGGLSVNGTLVGTGGFQGGANTIRYLRDCDTCDWVEYPNGLAAPRWYSTQATLPDGGFIVVGGRGAMSYEYIPLEGVKNTKLYRSPLLEDTTDKDENNLYPFVYLSTDGNLFIFANDRSILLNPNTNKVVREFPVLPGGARNYPASGSSVLLPIKLHPANGKVISADVLICGGAPHNAYEQAGKNVFLPALDDCGRITITSKKPKWKIEKMPSPRVMGDAMILPTGEVLLLNGAKKGSAGWHFAQEPNMAPALYTPSLHVGHRFRELAPSNIPRMYHSSSAVLPDAKVLVAGSNTNNGYVYDTQYPTELRVEKFSPPYLDPALADLRPEIVKDAAPQRISYGKKFKVQIISKHPKVELENVMVTMYAPAFTTHGISMNQRLIILASVDVNLEYGFQHSIDVVAPPSGKVAPPGYYLLYVVYRGVPSIGVWVQIK